MKLNLSRFFQSNFNVFVFRYLGLSLGFLYIRFLGRIYYFFNKEERLLIEKNIEDFLQEKDSRILLMKKRKIFDGIFHHYSEKMFSAYTKPLQVKEYIENRVDVVGEDLLIDALVGGRGVILVTAHFGAVEYIPWVLGTKQYPVSVIMEFQSSLLRDALQRKIDVMEADVEMISEAGGSVYRAAIESLAKNRILMTECDEVDTWRIKTGRTIDLFGKKLYYDNTIDVLSHRSGAPVIGVFLKREMNGRFTLMLEPLDQFSEEKTPARKVFQLWERYVMAHPEQWYQWKKWQSMKA